MISYLLGLDLLRVTMEWIRCIFLFLQNMLNVY